ncbi:hypothetical protein BKA65DRAFT_201856 [Rhexocercosporidium sp. MPI-PUGE-AT-0058]|nr:hypothetical protein BKA65DRAFT_201856 [Rhexocercosporidium sp. MPI-PUGE-AT-0058]
MRFEDILFLALKAVLAIYSPVQNPRVDSFHDLAARYDSGANYLDACNKISKSIKSRDYSTEIRVNPDTTYKCLKSTPYDAVKARSFIDEIKKYAATQSTLAYLKGPPEGYLMPAVDIIGEFDSILRKVYNSHYDFNVAVAKVFTATYDGHFRIKLCSRQLSFTRRELSLVSFANDSYSVPRVYLRQDTKDNYVPSPVYLINRENAESYIKKYSLLSGRFHDPDTLYNSMFNTIQNTLTRPFAGLIINYPPSVYEPYTNVTLNNGTTIIYDTVATVNQPALWTSINNTESFMETFCVNSSRFDNTTSNEPTPPPTDPTPPKEAPPVLTQLQGYPKPALPFYLPANFAGYFLNSISWEDIAVLAVRSFDDDDDIIAPNKYITYLTKYFKYSRLQSKIKLIIDISGNPGGVSDLSPTLFSYLFPQVPLRSYANRRTTKLFDLLSNIASARLFAVSDLQRSEYNYKTVVKPDQSRFATFGEYFGPVEAHNDNFTSAVGLFDLVEDIPSYLSDDTQPFAAKNIILLSDGQYSSAYATFYELIKTFGGVKNIVVGGRPDYKPMQFVGGTKGGLVRSFTPHFDSAISDARDIVETFGLDISAIKGGNDLVNKTVGDSVVPIETGKLPFQLAGREGNAVNIYNAFQVDPKDRNLKRDIPLQFMYEKADYRLFYTKKTVLDIEKHWARVAETTWGNGACVKEAT